MSLAVFNFNLIECAAFDKLQATITEDSEADTSNDRTVEEVELRNLKFKWKCKVTNPRPSSVPPLLFCWGSVKDSVVGEERIAQYLLAVLNTRGTPLHWKHLHNRRIDGIAYEAEENDRYNLKNLKQKKRNLPNRSDMVYVEDLVAEVQHALYLTLAEFDGNVEDESDLESLIDQQFGAMQKALKIPHKASEARLMVSKKFLTLFRAGKLGPFILDDVPDIKPV